MTRAPWTFDDFVPGATMAVIDVPLDPARIARWEEIYGPPPPGPLPSSLTVAAMMEAFINAIQPRPSGNVHASQAMAFAEHRPAPGDVLTITCDVQGKELKRGRRWVTFGVSASVGDRLAMTGALRIIWAA
ncbi:MAG: hypothetical protein ACJA1L_002174 [Paracoccaceae bacterium]|jgi:hypothetical protein